MCGVRVLCEIESLHLPSSRRGATEKARLFGPLEVARDCIELNVPRMEEMRVAHHPRPVERRRTLRAPEKEKNVVGGGKRLD